MHPSEWLLLGSFDLFASWYTKTIPSHVTESRIETNDIIVCAYLFNRNCILGSCFRWWFCSHTWPPKTIDDTHQRGRKKTHRMKWRKKTYTPIVCVCRLIQYYRHSGKSFRWKQQQTLVCSWIDSCVPEILSLCIWLCWDPTFGCFFLFFKSWFEIVIYVCPSKHQKSLLIFFFFFSMPISLSIRQRLRFFLFCFVLMCLTAAFLLNEEAFFVLLLCRVFYIDYRSCCPYSFVPAPYRADEFTFDSSLYCIQCKRSECGGRIQPQYIHYSTHWNLQRVHLIQSNQ